MPHVRQREGSGRIYWKHHPQDQEQSQEPAVAQLLVAEERLEGTLQTLHTSVDPDLQLSVTHCVFCVFLPIPFHPFSELSVHGLQEGGKPKAAIRTAHIPNSIKAMETRL